MLHAGDAKNKFVSLSAGSAVLVVSAYSLFRRMALVVVVMPLLLTSGRKETPDFGFKVKTVPEGVVTFTWSKMLTPF